MQLFRSISDEVLRSSAQDLYQHLPEASLFDLQFHPGQSYVFVSVLLHGNEPAGWQVIQKLFAKYQRHWPYNLLLFVGNLRAAHQQLRRLPEQPDWNRIWAGGDLPEQCWAQSVLSYVIDRQPLWGLDFHNNSGKNPFYACINQLHDELFRLAAAFSDIVVFFETPKGALGLVLSEFFPILTLECGQVGDLNGVRHAFRYVDSLLQISSLQQLPLSPSMQLYEVDASVKLTGSFPLTISRYPEAGGLCLYPDLEEFNFRRLTAGTEIGRSDLCVTPLRVEGVNGEDLSAHFLQQNPTGEIQFIRDLVPSMISLQPQIIRQDCLCYLMAEKIL